MLTAFVIKFDLNRRKSRRGYLSTRVFRRIHGEFWPNL